MIISVAFYALWDHNEVVNVSDSVLYEIYKPDEGGGFDELKAANSDVIGWINVYGTNIDYPIVQGETNQTYLNHSPLKEYSLSGSIFLDYRNDKFNDFNTILYGHNMSPAAMFGSIKHFKEKRYFDEHKYGDIYFEDKHHGIEFFALIKADGYDFNLYDPGLIEDGNSPEVYLNKIKEQAVFTRDVDVSGDDKIVLLSTCSNVGTNSRDVLIGRILDSAVDDPFPGNEATNYGKVEDQNYIEYIKSLPLFVWILLALLIIIIIFFVVRGVSKLIKGTKVE